MDPKSEALVESLGDPVAGKTLSDTSIDTYAVRLRMLAEATGKPIHDAIAAPKASYKKLQTKYPSPATRKNVVTAVVAVVARNRFSKAVGESWRTNLKHLMHIDQALRDDNRTSDSMRENMIDVREVSKVAAKLLAAKPDTLRKSHQQLVLTMFVDMPPKRADFGRLQVKRGARAAVKRWAGPEGRGQNFVVIPEKGAAVLIMHDYKTAKTYGVHEETLPDVITKALRASLSAFPRDFVFGPATPSGFGHFVKATFKTHMGKAANVNLIRHAYITQVADPKTKTQAELKVIARSMCHSVQMQGAYFLVGGGS